MLTSCGLPGDGSARTVDDDTVPYHLLERESAPVDTAQEEQLLESAPIVFWLVDEEFLVPAALDASCGEPPETLVEQLLGVLAAGPTGDARAAGKGTAIPPESGLQLLEIREGTAQIEVDPASEISADRLPVAIGQVVLSVTSAPGVETVELVSDGQLVQVPLPDGALAAGPVTPSDYASLVPDRFRDSREPLPTLKPQLGCQ
jgi:spore germination protein GerM